MRVLKTAFGTIILLLVISGIGLYLLANHSTTQTFLTCSGMWQKAVEGWQDRNETVYAVLEEYRPWIIWTTSDGNLRAESRDYAMVRYVGFVDRIGDKPLANYWLRDSVDGAMVGGFREGPDELILQFTENMLFVGTCTEGI